MSQISPALAAGQSGHQVRRWRAFAVLAVAFFMTVADLAIVNVALPTIGRKLHMAESDLQWVVTGYGLTFGGFLLLGGRAADLLGRRRVLMAGLFVFTVASLGCGLASAEGFLIAMRFLQGLGAAIIVPAALSIVMNMFPEGAERNKALGAWGAIGASGATVGVIAGGLLTRYAGWEYIFFLNVPIGAAALALAPRVVPESRLATERRRYDPFGAITVTGGLSLLVYAISTAPQIGWTTARTVVLLAVSVALLAAFLVIETRAGAADAAVAPGAEDARGRERGRPPARRQLLRVHLHRHPVHAAGARLLRAAGRPGLAGGDAYLGRLRRGVAGAGHPRFGQAGDGGRHGHDRRRRAVDHPGARARELLGQAWPGPSSSSASVPRSPSSRSRSPPWPESPNTRKPAWPPGLLNTSQQLGGAIEAPRWRPPSPPPARTALLHEGAAPAAALSGGFQWAFWACGLIGSEAASRSRSSSSAATSWPRQ